MEAVAEKQKVSDLQTDDLVKLFRDIRDKLSIERKAWEEKEENYKTKMAKIQGILLARFRELGIESARTQFGTAFKDVVTSASVADRDVFFSWVFDGDHREFVEARVNKTAVKQYLAEHGDLPPGVNWFEEVTIKVRKA